MPAAALDATLRGISPAGLRGDESGAFWLGHRGPTATISAVVLPRGEGVLERPDMWQVSPDAFGSISRWASMHSLVMLGMFHIHLGHSARMSRWDRERVVQVPDMLSVIAPRGGIEPDPYQWGWYVFENTSYREMDTTERGRRVIVDAASCSSWIADAFAVRPFP